MPGLIGYDPDRTRELRRRAHVATEHLLVLPPGDDPFADAATTVARLVRAHLERDWIPAIDRVLESSAMLVFSGVDVDDVASRGHGLRPLSAALPTRHGGDSGPPAANSLESELNPAAPDPAGAEPAAPPAPITEVVLPNGWSYTCGPDSAATGKPASGCAWMPPTTWDMAPVLLAASFLPVTGEILDTYDCITDREVPCELVAVPFVSGRGINALEEALVGIDRAADARRAIDLTSPDTWANARTLQKHFDKHGSDFSATSAEDYARQASEFFDRAVTENLPTKIDPSDGTIRMWDPATNTFGSFTQDGTTRTFFKPSNPSYWERQAG